ncbi:sorbitol dehydrogenase-like isoform X2 [Watersipora subatra]
MLEPAGNEVLLKMGSVGICGSDLKYWKYAKCGRFNMKHPMVIGHEGSGTVISCGPQVQCLQPGDRVAIEPGVPCRQCSICRSGRYNLCSHMRFCATPPVDGNLCQFYKHPEDFCFKLPTNVSLNQGALIEPLAVAVYACERGNVGLSSNVLICGAGAIGLLVLMTAKSMGAANIIITDISEERLALAKSLGATHTINMINFQERSMEEVGETLKNLCSEIDATIECSGVDSSVSLGIHSTQPGGCLVMVGRGSMEPTVPLVKAATYEVDIKGVFRYANCYPKAIALVSSGSITPESTITHTFQLEESEKAFQCADTRTTGAVKVMIQCNT